VSAPPWALQIHFTGSGTTGTPPSVRVPPNGIAEEVGSTTPEVRVATADTDRETAKRPAPRQAATPGRPENTCCGGLVPRQKSSRHVGGVNRISHPFHYRRSRKRSTGALGRRGRREWPAGSSQQRHIRPHHQRGPPTCPRAQGRPETGCPQVGRKRQKEMVAPGATISACCWTACNLQR